MIVSNISDNHITGLKFVDRIGSSGNIIGSFEKNTGELKILNLNHIYDGLKGKYIDIKDFGEWYVEDLITDEEFTESTLSLFDITHKFDSDYEDVFLFPAKMGDWAVWIGNKVGVPLKGTFLNYDLELKERPYLGDKPKYRDAVKIIAKYASGYAQKNYDNTYSIKWFSDKLYEIEDWEKFLHGNTTSAINVVVLSTGDTEDNVKWPEKNPEEPHELRIEDDWINIDRYSINENIYNQVNGFSYTLISKLDVPYGILDLRAGEKIKTQDIEHQDIETNISKHTLEWQGGTFEDPNAWISSIEMEELKETSTKLDYANSFENRFLKVERKADKNAGMIEDLVSSTKTTQKELETLNPIKSVNGNPVFLENSAGKDIPKLIIKGNSKQEHEPSPSNPCEIKNVGILGNLIVKTYQNNEEFETIIDLNQYDEEGHVIGHHELARIDDVYDELEVASGHLIQRIGKIVLDNNSEVTTITNTISGKNRYVVSGPSDMLTNDDVSKSGFLLSDKLYETNNNESYNETCLQDHILVRVGSNKEFVIYTKETESLNSISAFKTWLSNNPITIYYKLSEPKELTIKATKIKTFEDDCYLKIDDELIDFFDCDYYTKSKITEYFETQKDSEAKMQILNDSITQSVSEVNTTIKNNELAVNDKLNNYATNESVTQQISSVENKITSSEQKITIINEQILNGITQIRTENGFTFNIDGLTIDEVNSVVKNLLNQHGMIILDKSNGSTVLFAGYDEELHETVVRAENMTVGKYFVAPNCRIEKYNNPWHGEGTGVFSL
ncbi:MAG: hypothetical protein HFI09_04110 [Bacilli bacterium]|nr:hypothetical protein [Bacilli bacterium]